MERVVEEDRIHAIRLADGSHRGGRTGIDGADLRRAVRAPHTHGRLDLGRTAAGVARLGAVAVPLRASAVVEGPPAVDRRLGDEREGGGDGETGPKGRSCEDVSLPHVILAASV